jgi:hypothetical protein
MINRQDQEAPEDLMEEEEIGSPDGQQGQSHPHAEGTDADLAGAVGAIDRDPKVREAVGGFSPSRVLLTTICAMVIAPPPAAGTDPNAPAITPEQRAAGFIGLSGPILEAVDFDGNVLALLETYGVGSNLSPAVAVGIGAVAIVAAAFLYRAPKAPKTSPAPAKAAA